MMILPILAFFFGLVFLPIVLNLAKSFALYAVVGECEVSYLP